MKHKLSWWIMREVVARGPGAYPALGVVPCGGHLFSSSKMELYSLALVLGDGVEEVDLRAFEHVSIGQVLLV